MEVSTFELLYKPLTPTGGDIARRVLQGYFLTITNLEAQDYCYRIEFIATRPDPYVAERTLDPPQALFIADTASPDNVFSAPLKIGTSTRYSQTFLVRAGQTALVVLLPNITLTDFFSAAPANQEVRGYVRITLPCVLRLNPLRFVPQSDRPVRVLLNPELRATYLPNGWPAAPMTTGDFDQTITSMALASGRGLNEIPPSRCLLTLDDQLISATLDRLPHLSLRAEPADQLAELLASLAQLDDDERTLPALNDLLGKTGIPLEVRRRGARADGSA